MNRNLSGERFSRAELIEMAVSIGAVKREKITRDVKTHVFADLTRAHRFAMFMRGEAILDSRPEPERAFVAPTVDWEVVTFLRRASV
jgi:hypothetical protein